MAGRDADEGSASEAGIASLPQKVLMASGTSVNVQRVSSDARVSATVLGSVPGLYIALRDSQGGSNSRSLRSLNLLMTDDVILRFLHDGVIYGFKAAIWRFATEPEYLLFLHYPSSVERASVRQAARTACRLPCQISFAGGARPGLMLDVSAAGCAVVGALEGAGSSPKVGDPATVTLALPAKSHPLQATGHIRRINADIHERVWRAGIAFGEHTDLMTELEPYLKLAPIE